MRNKKAFKHGEAFIHSMEVLIERYNKAIKLGISKWDYEDREDLKCLLCNPLDIEENRENSIRNDGIFTDFEQRCAILGCPWIVITGKTCDDRPITAYNSYNVSTMKRRVNQLRNWIKIYKYHMGKI